MHVGFNAHLLSAGSSYRAAGISRHIWHLLRALARLGSDDAEERPDRRLTVFAAAAEVAALRADLETDRETERQDERRTRRWAFSATRLPTARPTARILWEQLVAPYEITRRRVDLFHAPAYVLPLICPARTVVTIHDLSFYLYPQLFNRANRLYLGAMTRLSAQRADRVIAVSAATAADTARLLGVPAGRVAVVPNGVEERFRPLPAAEVAAFRARRSLPERFILHLGTLEPRKNHETLIRAYAILRHRHRVPHQLVLAGGRGWLYEDLFRLVEGLGLAGDVTFTGFVDWAEQPLWYNAAALFAYPSLYEGFGLPPLEAMACGTPVVAANVSSLPEVVGDAGLLVSPTDESALAEAILAIIDDPRRQADLAARGRARARLFTWERAARQTRDVYDRVVDDPRR